MCKQENNSSSYSWPSLLFIQLYCKMTSWVLLIPVIVLCKQEQRSSYSWPSLFFIHLYCKMSSRIHLVPVIVCVNRSIGPSLLFIHLYCEMTSWVLLIPVIVCVNRSIVRIACRVFVVVVFFCKHSAHRTLRVRWGSWKRHACS